MSKGMDLTAQKALAQAEDQGTVVHIHGIDEQPGFYTDENGEQKPVTITVTGIHSKRYREIEKAQRRRKIKPRQLTQQAFFEDAVERAVACTIAWEGLFYGEEAIPFTPENVRIVYKSCDWIYDQINEAMQDPTRFFGNDLTEQSNT